MGNMQPPRVWIRHTMQIVLTPPAFRLRCEGASNATFVDMYKTIYRDGSIGLHMNGGYILSLLRHNCDSNGTMLRAMIGSYIYDTH